MTILSPPTSRLPPIRQLTSSSLQDLSAALKYLRLIYNPEVRGSRRRRASDTAPKNAIENPVVVPLKPPAFQAQDPTTTTTGIDDDFRSDAFERSYAIRWLTALISQTASSEPASDLSSLEASNIVQERRESLIQDAASLLAVCSGTSAAGTVVRDFSFVAGHGDAGGVVLNVHLTDVPLDNHDFGSVGAQTWGGACVLAEAIVDCPAQFGLAPDGPARLGNMRILELGAGTGLVSLAVGKLIESSAAPNTTIIATDYYPSVMANLEANVQANFPSSLNASNGGGGGAVHITTHALDWSLFANDASSKSPPPLPPFDAPFDLILGADIVYESQHAVWIKSCLTTLLRKPDSANPDPSFHLMIPLRTTHASESSTVELVFPRQGASARDMGWELGIVSKDTILCDAEMGSGKDQVEYAYYKIGWWSS